MCARTPNGKRAMPVRPFTWEKACWNAISRRPSRIQAPKSSCIAAVATDQSSPLMWLSEWVTRMSLRLKAVTKPSSRPAGQWANWLIGLLKFLPIPRLTVVRHIVIQGLSELGGQNISRSNMTKRDLVNRISEQTGLVQQHVLDIVQKTLDYMSECLAKGEKVELRNFGVFEIKVSKARIGRNPNQP